ncbi:MAG: DUF202 domain-containing protein [Calditrichaeota bacterium]|nr:MAG: DUF202 domain-containing protein [Calditrichota bacterium]
MLTDPYIKYADDALTLRDNLAIDRTVLANERTLLAYSRTGLAVFLTGISLFHFLDELIFEVVGVSLVPMGVLILAIGVRRYRSMRGLIQKVAQEKVGSPHR